MSWFWQRRCRARESAFEVVSTPARTSVLCLHLFQRQSKLNRGRGTRDTCPICARPSASGSLSSSDAFKFSRTVKTICREHTVI